MTERHDNLATHVKFAKMHGAGNDYIYIDATATNPPKNLPLLARLISDRHFGIGTDGLVLIMKSDKADFRMRMFNADGSEAQMCGNASRCIGKYVFDKGLTHKTQITLDTLAGVKTLSLHLGDDGKVASVTVDMGIPVTDGVVTEGIDASRPVTLDQDGTLFTFMPVSMGNPHAVIFGKGIVDDAHVLGWGPKLECHPVFPHKANIEFAEIIDPRSIRMRVWERGTGETLACGTGACATAVAAAMRGLASREVDIILTGGTLHIRWDEASGHVFMTGPASWIAEGIYYFPTNQNPSNDPS